MRQARGLVRTTFLLAALLCFDVAMGHAQTVEPRPIILILAQDRLLTESVAGQNILEQENIERTALLSEGQSLDQAFEAEELQLTELRATTPPEQFRELADAFDTKVIATRQAQEDKATALAQNAEQRRRDFYQDVVPILTQILDESGAAVVLDQRSVLISNQNLNITDEVIRRLDALSEAGQDEDETAPPTGVDNN